LRCASSSAGVLLLLGVLTRFAAAPMMIVVLAATIAAKSDRIDFLETLLGFDEVTYFVMFAWLAIAGAGSVSLEHLVLKAFRPDRLPAEYGAYAAAG